MSLDLQWELIKKHNCFMFKNNGLVLTREPFNLMKRHKRKYCGLVQKKAVDIHQPDSAVDSLLMTIKHGDDRKIKKLYSTVQFKKCKKGIRPTLKKTGHIVKNLWINPWTTKTALKVASNLIKNHSKQTRNRASKKVEGGAYVLNKK